MPFNTREKLLAWRATPEFKKRNYERVKRWRARPENRPKRAEEARRWRAKYPEKFLEIKERYRSNNLGKVRKRDREARREERRIKPELQRERWRRWREKRERELEVRAGRPRPKVCEICDELNIRVVFDHCHACEAFRGWPCDRCNRVLGLVKDSAVLLRKLASYVERHGCET